MKKIRLAALISGSALTLGYFTAPFVIDAPTENESQLAENEHIPHHAVSLPKEDLQPFLDKHCVRCHGPKKQKGQVRFDEYSWVIDNESGAQRWQDVLDQLNGGDMPPEEEDQPSNEELTGFLATLSGSLNTAKIRLADHGGEIKMRRLNRREYAATMEDLFGLLITEAKLPEDGGEHSFDTVGDDQYFTSVHFKEYLAFSRKFMPNAMHWSTQPHWGLWKPHHNFGASKVAHLKKMLAVEDKKLQGLINGVPYKELGFANAGDAKQFKQQSWLYVDGPKKYLSLPKVDKGVYFTGIGQHTISGWQTLDPRGEYNFKFHGGIVGDPIEARKHFKVYARGNNAKTVRIRGTVENPETVEATIRVGRNGDKAQKIHYAEHHHIGNNPFHRIALKTKDPLKMKRPWASIWLDWVKIEGPHYPEEIPKIVKLIYGDKKPSKKLPLMLTDDAKARDFIEKFAFEAFRRQPIEPEYIDGLYQIFKEGRAKGYKFLGALNEPLAIILASPKFLYITEKSNSDDKKLTDRELAIRLSYYIWSRPPDDELYAAAAAGKLSDPKELDKQLDRMLAHKNAKSFSNGFMSQWAELDRFNAISINRAKFPTFNGGLRQSAKQEAREFFHTIVSENLPASNLIDSDFITVNGSLAAHYGIKDFTSRTGEFVKVKLPPNSPRGGMMTQAHFLVSGSNGERSSPVIRGAMVLDKLLHDKPPPPPPNVPELDEASDKPHTNRELVLLHQERASCASCHKKMDVIGFGLENFDQTGAWRTHEKVGNKSVLIQPGGTLPDGTVFNNINELKKALLKHEDALAKELTSSILAYALGRTVSFTDQDDIEAILAATKPGGYKMKDLVKEIAKSPLFKNK